MCVFFDNLVLISVEHLKNLNFPKFYRVDVAMWLNRLISTQTYALSNNLKDNLLGRLD